MASLKLFCLLAAILMVPLFCSAANAQNKVIVGYFHNWNNASAPYIRLRDVNSKYNVINIAFATPVAPGDMTMTFAPTNQAKDEFISDIRTLQSQGRRVQISIGGADAPVELNTSADVAKFVSSMKSIITEYGFDGFDIDLEGTSVILNSGDNNFKAPTTPKINNLIAASRELTNYFRGQGRNFWLTSAPEVQYVQGGYGNYGTAFGGYLPILYGLRDILTFVHVQYYNTGSQIALDEGVYSQGTADFTVSMTDMLLRGFPVARNSTNIFPALREDQVAFGLPATNNGAAPAGGYLAPADVTKALNYLVKGIPFGGQYVLSKNYPNLRGIMTWSVNWDKTQGGPFVTNAYNFFNNTGGTNPAPTVSITSPANNAVYAAPATINITANAADNGSVAKVEFFNGTTKLGEDSTSPYTYSWTGVAAGSYTITAKATDNQGATASASVNITVTGGGGGCAVAAWTSTTIYTQGNQASRNGNLYTAKWWTQGDDPATHSGQWDVWRLVGACGTARSNNSDQKTPADYASSRETLSLQSAVVCSPTWSSSAVYIRDNQVSRNGNNYLAKWWTQGDDPVTHSGQWDVWRLIGSCGGPNNTPPTVTLTSPASGATFTAPANITISANASDAAPGSISKIEFFSGTTLLFTDDTIPYTFTWSNVPAGSYTIIAKATDNEGATASVSRAITVNGISPPPTPTPNPTPTPTPTPNPNPGLPKHIMSGYWHSWNGGVPFIKLRDVHPGWDVINIAFAEPVSPGSTDGRMKFVVSALSADYTTADFKADIRTLQSRGKKVVLSIGGYEGYFSLGSPAAVAQFVNDIKGFVDEYGFDGIDIDTEQSSVAFNGGQDPDFRNPNSPKVVNMISAIRQIVDSYPNTFILSWAPETFYFQLGHQFYGGSNGNIDARAGVYIPMIHALRDRTTYVQAQLYNSMAVQGNDGVSYSMGTVEGITAMTEMVIQGFTVGGNANSVFPGLRPDQVVIAVPASGGAAGSGQISNAGLQEAFNRVNNRYPGLRGIMAWSINWDAYQNNNSFVASNSAFLRGLPSLAGTPEEPFVKSLDDTSGLKAVGNSTISSATLSFNREFRRIYRETKAVSGVTP